MSISKKIDQIAALRLEKGKLSSTAFAYGGSTILALGANHAFPYLEKDIKLINTALEDESIDGQAFRDLPVQAKISGDGTFGGNMKYGGMDRLLYWLFGYEDGGSSPEDLTGGVYGHLFELDEHERGFLPYRTAEQTAGDYGATDRKNRYAVIGIKKGTTDFRYPFALCGGFGFSSAAGDKLKFNAKIHAYREDRGDYSSASWTYPEGSETSALLIPHHQLTLSMGPAGALVALAVTDFKVDVEIPLSDDQDSESGLYRAEPEMTGKYGVSVSFTLSRHAVDTYMTYRDSFTAVCMKAVWTSGDYEFGLYFPDMRITEASASEDDVSRVPITFVSAKEPSGGNPFSTEIGSCDIIQGGPVFCLVKNASSVNEMRRE